MKSILQTQLDFALLWQSLRAHKVSCVQERIRKDTILWQAITSAWYERDSILLEQGNVCICRQNNTYMYTVH